MHSENQTCKECGRSFIITFDHIWVMGAGSAADYETDKLPCGHESNKFDSNRFKIFKIEEVTGEE